MTLDIVGHGYSDGERCYIANHEDVVEDWLLCISSAFKNLPQVPWFVAGQSMGGTFSLAVAHKCNNLKAGAKDGYFSRFSGCISICPSLKVSIPPSPIVAISACSTSIDTLSNHATIYEPCQRQYFSLEEQGGRILDYQQRQMGCSWSFGMGLRNALGHG